MNMDGLFYYHDGDGITFLRLYADGRVISYGKSTKFDQFLQTFPWFRVESDKILFAKGKYKVEKEARIRILVIGEYGKMDYHGRILDADTMALFCRCRFTNYRKSETYRRFSDEKHIIHFEVSDSLRHQSN